MQKFKTTLLAGALLVSFISTAFTSRNDGTNHSASTTNLEGNKGEIIYLDKESFKQQVFNYEANQSWKYEGKVPAILDFYADWCGPCKQLSPVLAEMQKEYGDKIQIYKINTDKERELATTFGIRSLPTIVFVPLEGEPQAAMGFRPKADLETMVKEILKVKK